MWYLFSCSRHHNVPADGRTDRILKYTPGKHMGACTRARAHRLHLPHDSTVRQLVGGSDVQMHAPGGSCTCASSAQQHRTAGELAPRPYTWQ